MSSITLSIADLIEKLEIMQQDGCYAIELTAYEETKEVNICGYTGDEEVIEYGDLDIIDVLEGNEFGE